jgi:hypothetical protein
MGVVRMKVNGAWNHLLSGAPLEGGAAAGFLRK